jgi:uncharacterized protein
MPTEITVRGSFSAFQPPERGTVHASIGYEGSEMQWVYDRVAQDLETVKESIIELEGQGAVTWWSVQQLRTWSSRPWNKDGVQLPLVHHATVSAEVKFRDFAALSRWVGEHVGDTDGFSLSHVNWALTEKRRDELVTEVRTRAVQDAAHRAQLYADALGLGAVKPVAIADAGMLGTHALDEGGGGYLRATAVGSDGGGPDVELVPEDIRVSATIDGRFMAGAS